MTIYIPTSISEPPKEPGDYHFINAKGKSFTLRLKEDGLFYSTSDYGDHHIIIENNATHYLHPDTTAIVFTPEELLAHDREIAGKAWRAGSNRGYTECLMESGEMHDNPYPDKETYLNSLT